MTRIVKADEISGDVVDAMYGNDAGTTQDCLAAAITAWLAEQSAPKPGHVTPPGPEPETREVRIAVAIDTNGNAGVAVVTHGDDAAALEYAGEWTDTLIAAQGIVTARIPVIAIPVISGTVDAV